jgi:predicted phage terminase large subunit-like protein
MAGMAMTELEPQFARRLLSEGLRRDYLAFTEMAFAEAVPGEAYVPNWHIELVCHKLQQCVEGKIRRLIINVPPRSMKSIMASVALPAWILGREPTARVICVSYSQDLATKFSRTCRSVMQAPWYREAFRQTKISPSKNTEAEFETTARGYRMATSVGGTLTGRGGNYLILDDPMKPDEAQSEARRQDVKDWYDNTLVSRLDDKRHGVIIVVTQRLHADDLTAHLLAKGGWEIVLIPAIAEQEESLQLSNDPQQVLVRRPGDVLWPEREDAETLAAVRREMGEAVFNAQYQQAPAPPAGNLIKVDQFARYAVLPQHPKFDPAFADESPPELVQSWDTASKTGELNNYSVCTTWCVHRPKFYLLDVFRRRLEFPDLKRAVIQQAHSHGARKVIIEDKGSGTSLLQTLRAEPHDLSILAFKPEGDKVMRIHGQLDKIEAGRVLLPRAAPWLEAFLEELRAFPNGRFDDQVDSLSQFLSWWDAKGRAFVGQGELLGFY